MGRKGAARMARERGHSQSESAPRAGRTHQHRLALVLAAAADAARIDTALVLADHAREVGHTGLAPRDRQLAGGTAGWAAGSLDIRTGIWEAFETGEAVHTVAVPRMYERAGYAQNVGHCESVQSGHHEGCDGRAAPQTCGMVHPQGGGRWSVDLPGDKWQEMRKEYC